MKKWGSILLLSAFALLVAQGQIVQRANVSGRVVDASTKSPLTHANVFITGSSLGAATDTSGQFEIKNIPLGAHELVVSMIGYKRQVLPLQIFQPSERILNVQLQPADVQTEAVEVIGRDPIEWRKNLERFQREFFGETYGAQRCQILNKERLNFEVDVTKKTFSARAPVPLEIENKALGLKIRLWMEEFKIEASTLQYMGKIQFEYLHSSSSKQTDDWRASRRKAYFGSRRHFLAALAQGKVQAEGFEVYQVMNVRPVNTATEVGRLPVDPKSFVNLTEYEFQKRLRFPYFLQVVYVRESPEPAFELLMNLDNLNYRQQVSWITMNKMSVYFTVDGNTLEPYALKVFGYWAFERVAELLPLDYDPTEDGK